MIDCCEVLQGTNGLFSHAMDAPVPWGRANGLAALSLCKFLAVLPEDHASRPVLLQDFKQLMSTLRECQTTNGFWRQVLSPSSGYTETSASAMIAAAMAIGIKENWIESETYRDSAKEAWAALVKRIDGNGKVFGATVSVMPSGNVQEYLGAPVQRGEFIGEAAAIWCANAFMKFPELLEDTREHTNPSPTSPP
jgi:rhamnogalacturonyl hydrolase YesR